MNLRCIGKTQVMEMLTGSPDDYVRLKIAVTVPGWNKKMQKFMKDSSVKFH